MRFGENIEDVIKRVKEQMRNRDYDGVTTLASSDVFDMLRALGAYIESNSLPVNGQSGNIPVTDCTKSVGQVTETVTTTTNNENLESTKLHPNVKNEDSRNGGQTAE